jgi:hypothetical protein
LYKGHRFRSRLEARWAVFLDAIRVDWDYEKQGYDLNGRWYLPDFWVPYPPMKDDGWGFWIEIKPTSLTEEQTGILAELARLTGHRTFALCGQPWPGEHKISIFQHHHHGVPERIPWLCEGRLVEEADPFFQMPESQAAWRQMGRNRPPRFPKICVVAPDGSKAPFVESYEFWGEQTGSLQEAFQAARAARFEHGETPQLPR